jgi:hypothetical protein
VHNLLSLKQKPLKPVSEKQRVLYWDCLGDAMAESLRKQHKPLKLCFAVLRL